MCAPAIALAADLGRLTVLSGVGEPLRAEIQILSVRPDEARLLAARIPSADVFWRAHLERSPIVDQIRARVERRPNGGYVVVLSSTAPIETPFIQILVELNSTGRVVREYPFLLEDSRGTPRSPSSAIPTGSTVPDGRAPQTAPDGHGSYLVRPGDTLASIARATRSTDATVEQTIVALYRANESAFIEGNMNRFTAGTVLALPSGGAAAAIEPAEARRIILEQQAALQRSGRKAADAETGEAEGATAAKPRSARGIPVAGDQLTLSRPMETGSAGGSTASAAREDDIVALQRALAEAQERIAALQREIEDVRRSFAASGQQVGRAGATERGVAELAAPIPDNAAAAEQYRERASENRPLSAFLREHGAWLLGVLLVGYFLWVVMPVKTARAWLDRRRRRGADLTHLARIP